MCVCVCACVGINELNGHCVGIRATQGHFVLAGHRLCPAFFEKNKEKQFQLDCFVYALRVNATIQKVKK